MKNLTLKSAHTQRLGHIDAMRAVAVLLVVWTHYAEAFASLAGSQLYLDNVQRSVNFGRIGVVIFFAISGFLIPSSLRGDVADGTRQFLVRRFFRLFPAYWASIPLGYAAVWWLNDHALPASDIVANMTMLQGVLGFQHVMGHYWTLETELFFYLACLLLFWAGSIHQFRTLAGVAAGLILVFVVASGLKLIPDSWPGAYKGLLFHLAIMFWGACVRRAYDRGVASHDKTIFTLLTLAVVGTGAAIAGKGYLVSDSAMLATGLAYLVGLVAFAVMLTVAKLRNRALIWIGRMSYSLYLLHPVTLYVVAWYCAANGVTGWPLGIYMLAAFVPSLALAWVSFRFIETVGIEISKRLTAHRVPAFTTA